MTYRQEKITPYGNGQEKSKQVETMFDNIAHSYDLLNHRLSFGIDNLWRKKAINQLKPYKPETILDIATGTGDFAIMSALKLRPEKVIGIDISEGMMRIGTEKAKAARLDNTISFKKEDCERMSFDDNTFDAITTAFGIRNFQNLDACLKEMCRVLKDGGKLSILELSRPVHFPMRQAHFKRQRSLQISHIHDRVLSTGRGNGRDIQEGRIFRCQVQASDFRHMHMLFRYQINNIMDKYGLIGYPLGHSFSISYFNEKFENENIDAQYINFEIPTIDALPEVLVSNPELKGLNVTIPYKEKVIPFLDTVSPEARAIGAVNVIKVDHKGNEIKLKGYNSDVIGFTKSIEPMLERFHKKALILGTGGASKAINYGLKSLGLETVFVSRYERPGTIQYERITPDIIHEYNVIINCTPCGMYPHIDECPKLPYEAMDSRNLLYDLLYNPDQTLFMKKGAERGATVKNGLEMLLLQAFASWEFWNNSSSNK